jgi:hypothetical protein
MRRLDFSSTGSRRLSNSRLLKTTIVEIVRHAAGQLADRVEFLRLEQRFARAVQCDLRLTLFGHVARDFREADDVSGGIADRVDDDVRPELSAVFSNAPTFALEATFGCGSGQCLGRLPRLSIFVAVEAREVRADHFRRLVSLNALRTGIPVGDDAFGAQHVDGVVGHALNEQPELLLALPQQFFGGAPLGQVAGDLRVAEQGAVGREDRVDDDMRPETRAVLSDSPAFGLEAALLMCDRQRSIRKP